MCGSGRSYFLGRSHTQPARNKLCGWTGIALTTMVLNVSLQKDLAKLVRL